MAELAKHGNWTLHKIEGRLTARGGGGGNLDAAMYSYIEIGGAAFENVVVDSGMERFAEAGNEGVFYFATAKLKKPVTVFLAYTGGRGNGACRLDQITSKMAGPPRLIGFAGIGIGLFLSIFLIGLLVLPLGIWSLMVASKIKKGAFETDRALRQELERGGNREAPPAAAPPRPAPATA